MLKSYGLRLAVALAAITILARCSAGANGGPVNEAGSRPDIGSSALDGPSTGDAGDAGTGLDATSTGDSIDSVAPLDGALPDATIPTGDGFNEAGCGSASFAVHSRPPNVLILQDRSCSMRQTPAGTATTEANGDSKWSIATTVIGTLTQSYATQVRWGLMYLPRVGAADAGVSCAATPVCDGTTTCPEVAPRLRDSTAITTALDVSGVSPFDLCGAGQAAITPIDDALVQAGGLASLQDATRQNFVLLITDGEETCLPGAVAAVAQALGTEVSALQSSGIDTAVVGFGVVGAGGVNPTELNAMGAAGGVPATGANQYYSASDLTSLQTALATIIASTISCAFPIAGTQPANPSMLLVYVNGSQTPLARDPTHMQGWDYDSTTQSVVLYGTPCMEAKAGTLTQVNAVLPCGSMMPPPVCHAEGGTCTTDSDCCTLQNLACQTSSGMCVAIPG